MKLTPLQAHTDTKVILARIPSLEIAEAYLRFHDTHKAAMLLMPASIHHHHNFPGGYMVHIFEVLRNTMLRLDTTVFPEGKKPTLQAAVLAAYLHDLDKLFWRYKVDSEPPTEKQVAYARSFPAIQLSQYETKTTLSKKIDAAKNGQPQPKPEDLSIHTYRDDVVSMDDVAAVSCLAMEHKLPGLTAEVMHAISLHHGGWSPLARAGNVKLQPLAVILHAADMESANIQNGEV